MKKRNRRRRKRSLRQDKKKYWNDQLWSECQLVTLWNAAIYHGIGVPERYGNEYVVDCEMALAISGAALTKQHVIKKLGLKAVHGPMTWRWVCKNLPCEVNIICNRGYHSVLVVDIDAGKRRVAVTNLHRGRLAWMPWKELKNKWKIPRYKDAPIKWTSNRTKKP